jgi:hypothetical protein
MVMDILEGIWVLEYLLPHQNSKLYDEKLCSISSHSDEQDEIVGRQMIGMQYIKKPDHGQVHILIL